MLHAAEDRLYPTTLIAGRLRPLRIDLGCSPSRQEAPGRVREDVEVAKKAWKEGRDSQERAIDYVVDQLLKELSW
ncbi:MAG TPA: hypothetical protein VG269_06405 [Tepidisphaeraceae bacterium]|jgi:hypothetical protein|nr:hypothetical protein [Tepidisphaeraceae bacterium]